MSNRIQPLGNSVTRLTVLSSSLEYRFASPLRRGWIETDMTAAVRSSPMNDEIIARTSLAGQYQPVTVPKSHSEAVVRGIR
jgi:hypothetical protein